MNHILNHHISDMAVSYLVSMKLLVRNILIQDEIPAAQTLVFEDWSKPPSEIEGMMIISKKESVAILIFICLAVKLILAIKLIDTEYSCKRLPVQ